MANPFINKPFLTCPFCKNESFGVLMVCDNHYIRRCANCNLPKGTEAPALYWLPKLKKKVIYLDQFVISNFVKSLHPDYHKGIDPFYITAFRQLDRLNKLHLVVCPTSEFHRDESELSRFPDEHKRVYELLSHGVTFWDKGTILRFQFHEHLKRWLAGNPQPETSYTAQDFCYGKLDAWQERLIFTVNRRKTDETRKELVQEKENIGEALKGLLQVWSDEKGKDFSHWLSQELYSWKKLLVASKANQLRSYAKFVAAPDSIDPLEIIASDFAMIFQEIWSTLKSVCKSEIEFKEKFNSFLTPESLNKIPAVRIQATIFAKLAENISSNGMNKDKVKASFFNDAQMMSTILPFCDAIFTEKQMAGFMRDNPVNTVLANMPKIFSLSNKESFLDYLATIEKDAPPPILTAVKEVYGEDWGDPYDSILGKDFASVKG